MNTLRTLTLAALLAAVAVDALPLQPADAQPTGPSRSVDASAAGHWVYDRSGTTIGSVQHLSADGRTATLMIGSYFQPGSHQAQIPASALAFVDGKMILQPDTMQALNIPAPH